MEQTLFVGLDVHAQSITAAVLVPDRHDPEVIQLSSDLNKVRRFFRQLSQRGTVRACYEASGAGFVLQRALTNDGFHCEVIAPSLIPRKPGDHRKTDRLDAIMLAKLYRSGHLTPVHVPTEEHEAVRRLLRTRVTFQQYCTAAKHRIGGILRHYGLVYQEGKTTWSQKHRQWLTNLKHSLSGAMLTSVIVELEHLEYLESQLRSVDAQLELVAASPAYRESVEALSCLRGIKTLTALTLLCEIDDICRFPDLRSLMAYFGLVPSENSSGNREYRGSITKAGNQYVRRLLIEAAWNNHHRAGAALILNRRRQGQPPVVVAIALKAQHRLYKRFWHLDQKKHRHVAITAVARELCGFIWAILQQLRIDLAA